MTEKYKILGKYIKDLSSETPDIETYLYVKEYISKYKLGIDISSKALKNKMIEVNTKLKFEDQEKSKKKSYFEIVYSTIVKIDNPIKDKEELKKIIFLLIGKMIKKPRVSVANPGIINNRAPNAIPAPEIIS